MPTDDERRRLAERLRREAHTCIYSVLLSPDDALRIADLIEPSCDREALLALADAMDGHADEMHDGCNFASSGDMRDYARRIREALGVQDA